jgi:hypothetical protein
LDGERPRQSSPATPPPHGAAFFRGVVTRPLPCERPHSQVVSDSQRSFLGRHDVVAAILLRHGT